jgi:hypothetical protein
LRGRCSEAEVRARNDWELVRTTSSASEAAVHQEVHQQNEGPAAREGDGA